MHPAAVATDAKAMSAPHGSITDAVSLVKRAPATQRWRRCTTESSLVAEGGGRNAAPACRSSSVSFGWPPRATPSRDAEDSFFIAPTFVPSPESSSPASL